MKFILIQIFTFKETNLLSNLKLFEHNSNSMKSGFSEKTFITYETCSKLPLSTEKPNLQLIRRNIQSMNQNSQDRTEINYSQFRNKLIDKNDHNSTFQKDNNFIVQGNNIIEIQISHEVFLFLLHIFYIISFTYILLYL